MDIDKSLLEISQSTPELRVRLFACNCCRRLIPQFGDLDLDALILIGEGRGSGEIDKDSFLALRSRFGSTYDSLYPGYGDPSPKALALSAAGEVAFTESTLDAAINAIEFSAEAIAKKTANEAPEDACERVYDRAYKDERASQAELMRKFFGI